MIKALERRGRALLVRLAAFFLGVPSQPVMLPAVPRILIIRLDERLGNLLLLTPLLSSLRQRYPRAEIEVLANARGVQALANHPAVSTLLPFRKRALFAADGPLAAPWRLRERRYDLCIDAANPLDPSLTQVLLTRFSGATHTIGSASAGFGPLFTAPVQVPRGLHEITLRLKLLAPLGPGPVVTLPTMPLHPLPAHSPVSVLGKALEEVPYMVLNVGARLKSKQLRAIDYAELVRCGLSAGLRVLITWGPAELALAEETLAIEPRAHLAPPTQVVELAHLMAHARRVVTCDTGPMHLAVAVGAPTCGIFVHSEPERFGYMAPPHHVIDARVRPLTAALPPLAAWLSTAEPRRSASSSGSGSDKLRKRA